MTLPVDLPPPELAGRKILIVKDDRLNVRILPSILKPVGYRSLRYDEVLLGLTTIEEIEQNTAFEWAS